ncbi:hypothetical protein ACJMK2_006389 [Sinanodonta woodiana]|uniref:Uncharacterized protein n=1 Tax=Sinanodonta woodiana TaxID=1069815 RepID=A0ABD3VT66_SINWO
MEAFTYENVYYDECINRQKVCLLPPVSRPTKIRENVFRIMSASGLIVCIVYIFFIKRISPLQMTKTDEKHVLDERIVEMKERCSNSSWQNDLPRLSSMNNIMDWLFKTYSGCPVQQN